MHKIIWFGEGAVPNLIFHLFNKFYNVFFFNIQPPRMLLQGLFDFNFPTKYIILIGDLSCIRWSNFRVDISGDFLSSHGLVTRQFVAVVSFRAQNPCLLSHWCSDIIVGNSASSLSRHVHIETTYEGSYLTHLTVCILLHPRYIFSRNHLVPNIVTFCKQLTTYLVYNLPNYYHTCSKKRVSPGPIFTNG